MTKNKSFRLIVTARRTAEENMIRKMARSLSATFSIRPGQELVAIVGDGHEPNNLAAIETWVRGAILDLDDETALEVLTHLVMRFGETLEDWETSKWQ